MLGSLKALLPGAAALVPMLSLSCASGDHEPARADAAADGGPSTTFETVFSDLPGALISVWGRSASDVWAVGSDAGDGGGAMILHYDGARWVRYRAGVARDLWWVHGFPGGPVYVGGSEGFVARIEGDRLHVVSTAAGIGTVFGIWGSGPNDVWAVGGDTFGASGAFVLRSSGASLRPADGIPVSLRDYGAVYKVWGTGADDVWLAGSGGLVLHYDGEAFTVVPTDTEDPLFTVHAPANASGAVAAVGGLDLGIVVERREGRFEPAALPAGTRQLFGVFLLGAERGYAVGTDGLVLERTAGGWTNADNGLAETKTLHAVWAEPGGEVFAVGGDVVVPPLGAGVLIHKGRALPSTFEERELTLVEPDAGADGGMDAASDGGPVGPDAGVTDGEAPDASPVPSSGAGAVSCGQTTCDLSVARCCIDTYAEVPATCVPLADPCPGETYPVECDESLDCPGEEICCARRLLQIGDILDVKCVNTCLFENLCGSPSDCLSGETCRDDFEPVGYHVCL